MESYYKLQYQILQLIDEGKGKEVFRILEKEKACGNTDALAIEGFLYIYGVGVPRDEERGKKLVREAVNRGNRIAEGFLKKSESGFREHL